MLKEIINRHKIKLILLGDVLVFFLSLSLMLIIRYEGKNTLKLFLAHFYPFTILLLIWITVFYIIDLYSYTNLNSTIENKKKLIVGIFINFFLSLGIFYIFGNIFSLTPKTNLLIFTIIFIIIDYLWRHFFSWFLKQEYNNSKILLISQSILNNSIIEYIKKNPQLGYFIEKCKKEELLNNKAISDEHTTIIIDNKSFADSEILKKLYNLISQKVEIISLVNFYEKFLSRIPLDEIKEDWFVNEIKSNYHIDDSLKNILDKILAIAGIIILLPIFFIVAILVKITSKGTILYKQTRVGKNNKPFILLKFRTMYNATEKNPDANGNNPTWCQKEDNRITKLGRILRRTHLDELPQLFNILKNDISFVGPRPERPEFVQVLEKEIPHYLFRQIIKPGLTGWAQITFRYSNTIIESKDKFEYDLYYIKNRNIFLDVRVILKTIQFVFTH